MPSTSATPHTRRRWRVLLALVLLALLAGAIAVGWWNARVSLSDEERHLVGTWTYQWDAHPEKNLGLEYEFRPDRTCVIRHYDPKTGALVGETTGATWRLSGDRLTVRHPEAFTRSFTRLLPSQRAMEEVSVLTPDGPDRFHYTGTIESTPTQPPVTGTMTRIIPAE